MLFAKITNISININNNHHDTSAYNKINDDALESIFYGGIYYVNTKFTDRLLTLSIERKNI